MARNYTPVGTGAVGVSPLARVPDGRTVRMAQAQQAGAVKRVGRRSQLFEGAKVSPDMSFDSAVINDMKTSGLLGSYADGTHITPFELGLDKQGMNDWIHEFEVTNAPSEYSPVTPVGAADDAAPLTLNPTSTINPDRPRTAAAGFEFNPGSQTEGKVTIMFRDGTLYNYYDVPITEWYAFKAAPSKGRFIKTSSHFDGNPSRGVAGNSPTATHAAIHKAARVSQKTLHKQQPRTSKRGGTVQIKRQTRAKRR